MFFKYARRNYEQKKKNRKINENELIEYTIFCFEKQNKNEFENILKIYIIWIYIKEYKNNTIY